jgi:aspartyl/asparaginyl-tRNA synthetase
MKALGIDEEELWWYLDTRRFAQQFIQVLDGFERLVLFVTGMTNIRDVIPSKNTIERRVLIFTKKFSLRRINILPKLQSTFF